MRCFEEKAVCEARRLSSGDIAKKADNGQSPEVLPMTLPQLMPSHYEDRDDLFVTLPDCREGLLQFTVAPLLQRDRRMSECTTDGEMQQGEIPWRKTLD